jgi:hypothetical protein
MREHVAQSNVLIITTALNSISAEHVCTTEECCWNSNDRQLQPIDISWLQFYGQVESTLLLGAIACSFRCVLPVVLMHELGHMHGTTELI